MKYTQKALLFHKVEFDFGDKVLDYVIEDETARLGFSILYENIGSEKSLESYGEKGLSYLTLIIWAASILAWILFRSATEPLVWILIVPGLACAVAGRFLRFDATVLATPLGKILVFDRANQQDIIGEILRRRTAEIRRKYAEIDFLNDPKSEINKYRWLKGEGIISEQEFSDAIERISAAHRAQAGPS